VQPVLETLAPRNEVAHAFADHAKVRAAFCPPEALDLQTGLARMADWVREHGARDPVNFAGRIEISRRLPPSWLRGPADARH
jgi:UDP-glucose 4-epimerase